MTSAAPRRLPGRLLARLARGGPVLRGVDPRARSPRPARATTTTTSRGADQHLAHRHGRDLDVARRRPELQPRADASRSRRSPSDHRNASGGKVVPARDACQAARTDLAGAASARPYARPVSWSAQHEHEQELDHEHQIEPPEPQEREHEQAAAPAGLRRRQQRVLATRSPARARASCPRARSTPRCRARSTPRAAAARPRRRRPGPLRERPRRPLRRHASTPTTRPTSSTARCRRRRSPPAPTSTSPRASTTPARPTAIDLIAHELAHVVQQRGAPNSGPLTVSQPGDALETEADSVADSIALRF